MAAKRPRGRPRKFTVAQVEAALRSNAGIMLATAQALGCTRLTLRRYIDESPTLRNVVEDIRDSMIDAAEHQVVKGIANGDKALVMFYLRTQGKHRGWSLSEGYEERRAAAGPGGVTLVFDDGAGERRAALTHGEEA